MYQKPRLRRFFSVELVAPDTVFLLNEHRQFAFEGEVFARLIPLLDGQHDVADILSKVGRDLGIDQIYVALRRLARHGCLVEGDDVLTPANGAYWDYLGCESEDVRRIQESSVAVQTVGDCDAAGEMLTESLVSLGFEVRMDGDLLVVLADDYLHPQLQEINQAALTEQRPWCLVKPLGMVVWCGPFFQPGNSACWKCLEQRLLANRHVESYIRDRVPECAPFSTSKVRLPSVVRTGVAFAAGEIARFVVKEERAGMRNRLLTLDALTWDLEEHVLVKRPQCSACGKETSSEPQPLVLQSGKKAPGQQRTAHTHETFERYKHHLSPITGVVTSFRSRESTEFGSTHNYVAGHHFPVIGNDLQMLSINMLARSGGKGMSELEAKTSALCECLERYSGVYWGDQHKVVSSYDALQPDAIHSRDLLLFSDTQYETRDAWNAAVTSLHHYVPTRQKDDAEVAWCHAWCLTDEQWRYVPLSYCYYGHHEADGDFCRCDSNGSAAGNTIEEAIVQGFLELAERDAVAIWWYNRIRRPAVDVDSFQLPYWNKMRSYYADELGRELHVLDITSDLDIPTFGVVSRRFNREVEDIFVGFGSHLDPKTAMLRALGEANQYLPALRHEAPDGSTKYQFNPPEMIDWWKNATYESQPYLVPDPRQPPRLFSDFPRFASDDVLNDVRCFVELLKSRGLDLLAIDLTRPDVGMPVVKVIVPGLRHFWRRLAPGRLYDVPVQMGWLEQATPEAEMNPVSCFV